MWLGVITHSRAFDHFERSRRSRLSTGKCVKELAGYPKRKRIIFYLLHVREGHNEVMVNPKKVIAVSLLHWSDSRGSIFPVLAFFTTSSIAV